MTCEGRQPRGFFRAATRIAYRFRMVTKAWDRIETWLAAHAPTLRAELPPGASDAAIADCERGLGLTFPADLRASFARHDGGGDVTGLIGGWDLLELQYVISEHKIMK